MVMLAAAIDTGSVPATDLCTIGLGYLSVLKEKNDENE